MAWNKMATELVRRNRTRQPVVEEKAACAFGLVTRKGLEDLARDFDRLEVKINGLIFGVVATLLIQVWKSLL